MTGHVRRRAKLLLTDAYWEVKYRYYKFTGQEISGSTPFNWNAMGFNRRAVLSAIISEFPIKAYLEIGTAFNNTFHTIPVINKVGVDPTVGGTHRMTSDEFFDNCEQSFDLIFIDGLHSYEQVRQDVDNALKFLNPNGLIVLHDMLPKNWREQKIPRISGNHTGDGWKVAFALSQRTDLSFMVVTVDCGIGIIIKEEDHCDTTFPMVDMATVDFDFFLENYCKLKLVTFNEFTELIERRAFEVSLH